MVEDSFTPEQIAQRYGVKIATIKRWRVPCSKVKGPPYIKVGSKIFYPKKTTEEWERAQLSSQSKNPKKYTEVNSPKVTKPDTEINDLIDNY